jgi:hypothetical protein
MMGTENTKKPNTRDKTNMKVHRENNGKQWKMLTKWDTWSNFNSETREGGGGVLFSAKITHLCPGEYGILGKYAPPLTGRGGGGGSIGVFGRKN